MWKSGKFFVSLCILITLCLQANGQDANDFVFARNLTSYKKPESVGQTYKKQVTGNKNEIDALFSGLFLVYKVVLSSQDRNVCNFHPSCSEYGLTSIKQKGLIKGGIMTFDRLTRCNGLSPENYAIDLKLRKMIDPVQ